MHNILARAITLYVRICTCITYQGPPGTGKTVTSASIVYQLTKMNQG